MAKQFIYWYAARIDDNECYSVIGHTLKSVNEQLTNHHGDFEKPEKRVVVYTDMMDFFNQVTGEGGGRGAGFKP